MSPKGGPRLTRFHGRAGWPGHGIALMGSRASVLCSLSSSSKTLETSFTVDRRQTGSSRLVLTDSG